jgi:hypothetical protein
LLYLLLPAILLVAASLVWLRWDADRPLAEYFEQRHGTLAGSELLEATNTPVQTAEFIRLSSTSGLQVSARVIRSITADERLPVLIVLGGHRTGSDAVDLFGTVGRRAVVALDYPYDGPEKIRGFGQAITALPRARRAFIDTPPAVSLAVDWILEQAWSDPDQLVVIGASLGVPFAALVTARDQRIAGTLLVHGAADNLGWLETQVARRNDWKILHRPLATLIFWLAHGPSFDSAAHVAEISPRPVVIIGAREDERTAEGQTEALFAAAGEPKILRWTTGRHVQPGRTEIIEELLRIADEVLPFPPQADR